ncbi:hypothetical protein KP509_33G065900 [Ceratopteris richardii]|uniref:BZIP domain-containing protein n=1 Tax=Ceratopteris richardii TaxID=49495 RepID=A0A8T2QRN8_CERRI|nr:hypothetical protein KP509_33G065900 [Ceratopteris richardii]
MEGSTKDSFETLLHYLESDLTASYAASPIHLDEDLASYHPSFLSVSQDGPERRPSQPAACVITGETTTKPYNFTSTGSTVSGSFAQRGKHRRALSETTYKLPDMFMSDNVVLKDAELPVPDLTSELHLSAYLNDRNSNSGEGLLALCADSGADITESCLTNDVLSEHDPLNHTHESKGESCRPSHQGPSTHHHSLSTDGPMNGLEDFLMGNLDFFESKKGADIDNLSELSVLDPRRAKRILSNRLSAARSKERKVKYIAELEQKVQKLQTEATSLSAQLSALQRDSNGLSIQNNELKLRLQAMEQQAHLRDGRH